MDKIAEGRLIKALERIAAAEERRNEEIEADRAQRAGMFEKDSVRREAELTRLMGSLDEPDGSTIRPSDWRTAGFHVKGPACALFAEHQHITPDAIHFGPAS